MRSELAPGVRVRAASRAGGAAREAGVNRARAARQASGAVYALMFTTAVAQATIVPLLPTVQHRYGLDASSLAWILTLPSLAMLVTATPLGILGDRVGNRRVTAAAGALIALSTFAQGVPSLGALVVARLAFGVGYGALWTAGLAWLAGRDSGGSSRRMAATVTASAVGSTIGPILSGTLASHFGFATPFAVAGVATALVAAVLAAVVVAAPAPGTDPARQAPAPGTDPARPAAVAGATLPAPPSTAGPRWRYTWGGSTLALLRRPAVLAGAATLALSGGVASLLQLLVPLQLHASGHSAQDIGAVLSAGALVYIGVSALCVHLGPRLTNLRANGWLALLLGLALVPALVGSALVWVVAAVVLTVLPRAAIGTVAYALATDDRDPGGPGRGAVLGVLNSLWAVATVLAPVLAGAVSAAAGPRWAYAGAAALAGALALSLHRGARHAGLTGQVSRRVSRHAGGRTGADRPPVTVRPPASRPDPALGAR